MSDKILIMDDDRELRSELHDFLEGYEIVEASSGEEACKKAAEECPVNAITIKA